MVSHSSTPGTSNVAGRRPSGHRSALVVAAVEHSATGWSAKSAGRTTSRSANGSFSGTAAIRGSRYRACAVELVRQGVSRIAERGSFTLVTGVLAR
ncbi:hypothetical protein FHS29_003691 [Saccharothrix tamanrassetensis]|uniref:Uncharacterized protein n=1 Tax=Saccharothrix tamanrassetensis TaxID=1051531 RepID=A0A841CLR0_9PSEU|nr:hypothetical protein [Saccharothrix tamanrassetensis]